MVIIDEQNYLAHYGVLRRSGRYPWGSGDPDNRRNKDFAGHVNDLKRDGLSEAQIAEGYGISIAQLRKDVSKSSTMKRQSNIISAQRLADKGNSPKAISDRMGVPESTIRSWLAPGARDKAQVLESTSNMLREQVKQHELVDIGSGVENYFNISKEKLSTAASILEDEGYVTHVVPVPQQGTGKNTKTKVLCPPGTTWGYAMQNRDRITVPFDVKSDDGGRSYYGLLPPIPISPSRVKIAYAEDGGAEKDGVIYVRPNVKDLNMGKANYAQVRVQIGDGHFMKGMAMYKDDLPEGVDLVFHTNKSNSVDKLDVLKPLKKDVDNPFGSVISDQIGDMKNGKLVKVTSGLNIVNEEGDWGKWSKSIASQVLSKQSPALAKSQLDMTLESRQNEYASIKALTNSTVRKKLLEDFADGTDAASVHLKAAALPRQGWHAILPIESMKPSEIFAPNYRDGDLVALIRYPHGGVFEIPKLTVNNSNAEAKRLIPGARDAVGIHHSVAQWLSGADFDGDSVLVIPDNAGRIISTPSLDGLKNFDHIHMYPKYEGMTKLEGRNKQIQMGKISNLITDMTIHRAPPEEIAQAVRHSMVVIDADKHELNWQQSYIDNGISELKKKYQAKTLSPITGKMQGGASTIISKAKSPVFIPKTKPRPYKEGGPVDLATGRKVFVPTGEINPKTGKPRLQRAKSLEIVDDAHLLSSGTPMEVLYANHSNKLKSLANTARLEAFKTPPAKMNPSSKKVYASEVESLNAKLDLVERNRPLERRAQLIAGKVLKAKKDDDPNMDKATEKKIKFQALEEARTRTKAAKSKIKITESEWEAIQAGAISDSKLKQILVGADMDVVRELATPRENKLMTTTKTKRAKDMLELGYTRAPVAQQLGVSVSTLDKTLYSETT